VALRLGGIDGTEPIGARDDDEIGVAEVVRDVAGHPQLANHLVGRDQGLAPDVAATLGEHLVLDMGRGHPAVHVELGGPLDVEDVAVAAIHVDDHRRDVEMPWRDALLRVADGHGQLEFAQGAHRPSSRVGDLDVRIEVHVGGAQVADRERVAAEVDGLEAVVHHELGPHRVVDARSEEERLALEQLAHPHARMDEA